MAERLAGADFVRATACLMVLGHHVAQRVSPEALGEWADMSIFVQMFAMGVGAFFVLSGYLLARPFWQALDAGQSMPSLRTYAIRRGARILPGFWLALIVSALLGVTVLGTPLDGTTVLRFLAGFFLVADFHWLTWFPVDFNTPLWSISAEVTSYLLLPLGLWALFSLSFLRGWLARIAWVGVIAGVVGLQQLMMTYAVPGAEGRGWEYGLIGGAKFWWPNYSPISFFAMFAVGALASGVQVPLARFRSILFDVIALAGLALAIYNIVAFYPVPDSLGFANIPYGFPGFQLGVALILLATPSAVLLPRLTETPVIAYIAQVSFGVYIWHYLLMEVVRVLWMPDYVYWGMRDVGIWALISTAIVIASFAIATMSYRYFEAPVIRWARGLERASSARKPTQPATATSS